MATQIKIRGGTTQQHSSFTGAEREITVDTDKDVVVVHDGSTVGGHPLAKASDLNAKAPLASPALTGTPTAPTAPSGTSTTQIATTAFVGQELAAKAPLVSPTLTGTPTAPTASSGTSTTQIATTAFVADAVSQVPTADLSSVNEDIVPSFDGAFDIGSQAKSFDSLYLKTGVNFFGNNSITASASGLSFAGNTTFNGDIVSTGNITTTGDITAADGVLDTLLAGELLITDDVITPTPLNGCAVGTLTVNGAACVSGGTLTIACGGLSIQQGNLSVANGGITAQSLTTTGSISAAGLTSSGNVTVTGNINVTGSYLVGGSPLTSGPFIRVGCENVSQGTNGTFSALSQNSAILSGFANSLNGSNSVIVAGNYSCILGGSSFIGTGGYHCVVSTSSGIVSGNDNRICSSNSIIGAGEGHRIESGSCHSGIFAGQNNLIGSIYGTSCSSIVSGSSNRIYRNNAFIGGGASNTIDICGFGAGLVSGCCNLVYGNFSFIGSGFRNSVYAQESSIVAGRCNLLWGSYTFVGGGENNQVCSSYGAILGGNGAKVTQYGQQAHASGCFANIGDAQAISFVARGKTSTLFQQTSTLTLDGSSTLFAIENGHVYRLRATILGITSNGGTVAAYERQFTVKNVANTASLVGSVVTIGTDHEDNAVFDVNISVSNVNKTLLIAVTGDGSNTLRWVAHVQGVQVAYGT